MSDTMDAPKRKTISELIQNGFGTIVTRLVIIAMPFILSGAIWLGSQAASLWAEKILNAINNVDRKLDDVNRTVLTDTGRITALESQQAATGATVSGLRDRIDDSRGHR